MLLINPSTVEKKKWAGSLQDNYDKIDKIIIQNIEIITAENSTIWNSPDHNRKQYAHGLFQYPAMMVPVVQKRIIDIIVQAAPGTQKVVDPFMGSATSLVACMEKGLDCYGQDINPLSILIAKTRTGPYNIKSIKERLTHLIEIIERDQSKEIEANFNGINKWFKESVAIELSKIVRAIRLESEISIRRFYWINLAEVIRITSNDRTSTFKLHARPIEEIISRNPSPIKEFKNRLIYTLEVLDEYKQLLEKSGQLSKDTYKGKLKLKLQDSSDQIVTPNSKSNFFDLLVTSPPYGDNKTTVTYGQHSYLPLQWIDLNDIDENVTIELLKSTLEIDSRGLGGKVKKLTTEELKYLYERSKTFKQIHKKLTEVAPDKADKVVVFIKDLFKVIENIFDVMKINSYQVWTIGNRTVGGIEIPNNEILKEFIAFKGGKFVTKIEREILNRRMPNKNNNSPLMSFEDILIFRKIN